MHIIAQGTKASTVSFTIMRRIAFLLAGACVADAFSPPKTGTTSASHHDVFTLHTTAAKLSAAERYSGAGEATVDMNKYNLPVEQAAEEWNCILSAGTAIQEAGVYLECKNGQDYFVDTLKFDIRRSGGLGIELLELAGGREDGLGITMVSGIVEGSNADGSGIMAGDSISQLEVVRSAATSATSVEEETTAVRTECLGYDATIDAILSLPEVVSEDETVRITIKRIRRKPVVKVKLQYPPAQNEPDATIELFAGENLRRGMLVRGVKLNDKLSERFDSGGLGDCGADGTCATVSWARDK